MPRIPVHGVLLLDKSLGWSSHAALGRAKWLLNAAKAGHTGTLDPLASGLLPVCLGEATKFASDLLDADKTYAATVRLGETTTTGDAEGEVLERRPVQVAPSELEAVLAEFRGAILQIPPMYSALKRAGRPLYEYARAGVTLERAARPVTIHALELRRLGRTEIDIEVRCSKGTYIRTLAEDIGRALGTGAHLRALRRTAVGALTLDAAVSLEALEAVSAARRTECLLPVDALVQDLTPLALGAEEAARWACGQTLELEPRADAARVRVYAQSVVPGQFMGVGEVSAAGRLRPLRVMASRP